MTGGAQDSGAVKWEFDPLDGSIFFRSDPLTKYVVAELQSSDDSYGHMIVDAVNSTRATPAPAGWQPIESAPRDGTRILGWSADYNLAAAIAYDADFQCWIADNEDCWFEGNGETSHWMPLPTAPAEGGV